MVLRTDLTRHIVGKSCLQDISCRIVKHTRIFDIREMDALTHNRNVQSVTGMHLLHLEHDRRARLSLHPVTAFLSLQALCRHSVDLKDLVSAHKSVFLRRRSCIRLVDDDILFLLLMDDGSDASVSLGKHHLQILILFLWYIEGVRIQFVQHRVHSGPHDPVEREGVDICTVQFLQNGIMDLIPLSQLEALRLGRDGLRDRHGHDKRRSNDYHVSFHWLVVCWYPAERWRTPHNICRKITKYFIPLRRFLTVI